MDSISVNVFLTALENIAALRAQNGASMSRLNFQAINLSRQRTNMEAANGRIIDVDMGAESTRLAKYNVLTQSAAAMLAQANTTPDVALILLVDDQLLQNHLMKTQLHRFRLKMAARSCQISCHWSVLARIAYS